MKAHLCLWFVVLTLAFLSCSPAAVPSPTSSSTPVVPTGPAPKTPTAAPSPSAPTTTPVPSIASGPKRGGTLKIAVYDDIVAWDFMASNNPYATTRMPQSLAFNQVFSIVNTPQAGCTLFATPELADRFTWLDDLNLELRVRQGVRFHNKAPVSGRPLTAQDIAYSLQRLGEKQARVKSAFTNIEKIVAPDATSVRITLKAPDAFITQSSFLASSYGAYVVAPEAGGPAGKWDDPATSYIGTGPFMFESYLPGIKTTWVRSPTYWKPGLPYVDRVDFLIVPDVSSWAAALRSGKIDVAPYAVPLPMAEDLKVTAPQLAQHACPGQSVTGLAMRTDKPPLNDMRVRRALSMAVDRDGLNRSVWAGRGQTPLVSQPTADSLVAPWNELAPEVRKYLEFRPDEASRLLAEAGYPGGKGLALQIAAHRALTLGLQHEIEGIAAGWQKLGVDATVDWMDGGAFSRTVGTGKYEGLAVRGALIPLYRLAENYVSSSDPGQNASYVRDTELDSLFLELRKTADPAGQKEVGRKLQARLMQQVYYIQMVVGDNVTIWQPWVRNFGPVAEYFLARPWAEVLWLDRQ